MDQSAPRSLDRRHFLRTAAGASAGMASWLALRTPPAVAPKRELTFLSWNHFVPDAGGAAGGASSLPPPPPPRVPQKRSRTSLSWNHFAPAADADLRRQAEVFS